MTGWCPVSIKTYRKISGIKRNTCENIQYLPSMELTARTWKWMVGRRSFPFGARPIFRCLLVPGSVNTIFIYGRFILTSSKNRTVNKQINILPTFCVYSWWFPPIWKYLSQTGSFCKIESKHLETKHRKNESKNTNTYKFQMNTQVNINNHMVPFKGVNVCGQKIAPLPPLLLEAKSLELPVAGSNVRQHPRCGRNEGHEAPANTDPSHRMPGETQVETRGRFGKGSWLWSFGHAKMLRSCPYFLWGGLVKKNRCERCLIPEVHKSDNVLKCKTMLYLFLYQYIHLKHSSAGKTSEQFFKCFSKSNTFKHGIFLY